MTHSAVDKHLDHSLAMAQAARKKALISKPDLPDCWEAYDFRIVTGGIIAIGSDTRLLTRGPGKGMPTPLKSNRMEILITREDIDEQLAVQRKAYHAQSAG